MKIKTKIALVFTLMTATLLLLISIAVYTLSLQHTHGFFFTRLKVRASIAASSRFESNDVSTLLKLFRAQHLEQLPQEREFFFRDDNTLAQTVADSIPDVPKSFISNIRTKGFAQYHIGYRHYSGLKRNQDGNYIIIVSAYDENAENQMTFLMNLLVFTFLFSSILIFVLGRIFAFRIMAPISSIVARVHNITASDLGERITVKNRNDELGEIADTFNNMLDRLETTFELQSNFISNASHELKTPLTAILGEAEIILQSPRTSSEYQTSLQTIQDEAKRLDDVTSGLLHLSQISYDGKKQIIEPVVMSELLLSIKINLDKRIRDNKVKILIGQTADDDHDVYKLNCSRVWMELALTNIINNSIKYSNNKEVLVTLSINDTDLFIHISDSGIGIPENEIQHIFEPFFRASNTFKYTGYGIGLPLASKIIRLHGGRINIHSKSDVGTKVSLQFPRVN